MTATLGQALRQCRRSVGITQRALARRVGVDVSYISKLENDRVPPPAADTIVKMARVLNTAPDHLLVMAGKIPPAVSRMLGSNPAAMRFFCEAAELALTDQDWKHLSRVLAQRRDTGGPTADGVHPNLPGFLRDLFWDYDFENLKWPDDQHLILSRILAAGDWRSVTWLQKQVEVQQLRDWLIKRRGRGLDARRLRFWELILALPHAQVDAWIRLMAQDAWGQRTRA